MKSVVFFVSFLLLVGCGSDYRAREILFADLLVPQDVVGASKARVGQNGDGGYVIVDGFTYEKLYSYGISTDTGFEVDFVQNTNLHAHLYDHTIEGIQPTSHGAQLHWKKEGIADSKKPLLNTLTAHMQENGDMERSNMFLKMDIEGHEWASLLVTEDEVLKKFKQIVLELHGLGDDSWEASMQEKYDCLAKLNKNFQLVHVHGNNTQSYRKVDGYDVPWVLEVTYLRRDIETQFASSQTVYPVPGLDFANASGNSDLALSGPFAPGFRHD